MKLKHKKNRGINPRKPLGRVKRSQFRYEFAARGQWELFVCGVRIGRVTSSTPPTRRDLSRAV